MAGAESNQLRRAEYIKVHNLAPSSKGHNLVVKVESLETVVDKTRPDGSSVTIAEALVGDETGCIILTARNEQIEKLHVGDAIVIRNASVEVRKGFMRLKVDQWGKISKYPDQVASTPSPPETVDHENMMSNIEYELVTFPTSS